MVVVNDRVAAEGDDPPVPTFPLRSYDPPTLRYLGTLRDLTQGGSPTAPDDGMGGAGDIGSVVG